MAKKSTKVFTDVEQAAMKERAAEVKALGRRRSSAKGADGEATVLAKISEMPEPDRSIAQRFHATVTASAPSLTPKLWYGMPAYANKDGKAVCFFQSAQKFKTRYSSFGFLDVANLDEGTMWPTSFALKSIAAAEETRIASLLKRAVS